VTTALDLREDVPQQKDEVVSEPAIFTLWVATAEETTWMNLDVLSQIYASDKTMSMLLQH